MEFKNDVLNYVTGSFGAAALTRVMVLIVLFLPRAVLYIMYLESASSSVSPPSFLAVSSHSLGVQGVALILR